MRAIGIGNRAVSLASRKLPNEPASLLGLAQSLYAHRLICANVPKKQRGRKWQGQY